MTGSPYEAAPPKKLAEIIREAEALLEAQLTLGAAADQRALTFAGLLVTAVAALIGAAGALSASQVLAKGIFAMGAALFIAACCALWSARPTPWNTVGNRPAQWVDDIAAGTDTLHQGMAAMAGYYDDMIASNEVHIRRAAWAMRASMYLTALTMTGALIWIWWRLF